MINKKVILALFFLILTSTINGCMSNDSVSVVDSSSSVTENIESEVSDKDSASTREPFSVSGNNIKSLNCYNGTATAILTDGTLVLWGSNVYGSIGNGEIDTDMPATAVAPYMHDFGDTVIQSGVLVSSYALTSSGNLYTWGLNHISEAGHADMPVLTPTKIPEISNIQQVAMSSFFTLALKNNGTVFHTGLKIEQFENALEFSRYNEQSDINTYFTELPLDFICKKIDCSGLAYLFLTDDGEVFIQGILMGDNYGTVEDLVFQMPTKIDFPETIVDIAALNTNVVAISETGKVFVYGMPYSGLSSDETDVFISDKIYQKQLADIVVVDGTGDVVAALSSDGNVYAWGGDIYGTINNIDSTSVSPNEKFEIISQPIQLNMNNIKEVVLGFSNGTAISQDGDIYMWGSNDIGQIIDLQ